LLSKNFQFFLWALQDSPSVTARRYTPTASAGTPGIRFPNETVRTIRDRFRKGCV
jgi:hypothetical protein